MIIQHRNFMTMISDAFTNQWSDNSPWKTPDNVTGQFPKPQIVSRLISPRKHNSHHHWRRLLKISGGPQVCFTNSPSRRSQRTQNAADGNESVSKTQGTNGVELQSVPSSMTLLNSKNLHSQNKTDHIQLNNSTVYQKCGGEKRHGKL
jgi:hypothetical protein